MRSNTKTEKIKEHLEKYGSITSWEAFTLYSSTRLSAVIYNLKNIYGMNIETELVSNVDNNHKYAKYILVGGVE